jgi:hypothetical protein
MDPRLPGGHVGEIDERRTLRNLVGAEDRFSLFDP